MNGFWPKVQRGGPNDCWPWLAACNHERGGYGVFNDRGRMYRAHRLAFELGTGISPGRQVVMHTCDNPPCCNPAHLKLGTQAENIADQVAKQRQPRGEKNGQSRLSKVDVLAIRKLKQGGASSAAVARAFGINETAVYKIHSRQRWAWL